MEILISTGCGNIIQGGADIWTNHFLELVYPNLRKDTAYVLLIDGRKPVGWDIRSVNGIPVHFYHDDEDIFLNLLKTSEKIHFLHTPYSPKDYLMEHKDKFGVIFVHAYPRDMITTTKLQINTAIDPDKYDEMLSYGEKLVWIGINKDSSLYNKFEAINIPNFYEFKHNLPYVKRINPTIGFTSRVESRKNADYMSGQRGFVLTDKRGWLNMKDISNIDDSKIKFYQWNPEILDLFMGKTWSISHSCHEKEPFGYSIFQAVDWGKIPIIHTDWARNLEYKYRANTKIGFNMALHQISNDSNEELQEQFTILKNFMKNFDNKEKWITRITNTMKC